MRVVWTLAPRHRGAAMSHRAAMLLRSSLASAASFALGSAAASRISRTVIDAQRQHLYLQYLISAQRYVFCAVCCKHRAARFLAVLPHASCFRSFIHTRATRGKPPRQRMALFRHATVRCANAQRAHGCCGL